jgi:hypothetical protein
MRADLPNNKQIRNKSTNKSNQTNSAPRVCEIPRFANVAHIGAVHQTAHQLQRTQLLLLQFFFFFFSKQQKQLVSFKPARRVCSAKRNARSYQCSKCTQSPTSETANSCNEKREEKKKEQRQRKITFHEEGRRKSYCRDVQAAQMFAHSESSPTRSCHCIAAPTILKSLKKTKQKNKNKETLSEVAIRNWFVFAGCPMS